MNVANLDEYVNGPGGEKAKGLEALLAVMLGQAKEEGIEKVMMECRSWPPGARAGSSQEWTGFFRTSDTPASICSGVRRKLDGSPGEGFKGTLKLTFKAAGSGDYLDSYQRTVIGEHAAEAGTDLVGEGDIVIPARVWDRVVLPLYDVALRQTSENAQMFHQGAQLLSNFSEIFKPHRAVTEEGGGMLPTLLRGALGIADANAKAEAGNPAGAVAAAANAWRPPTGGGGPPPPSPVPRLVAPAPPRPNGGGAAMTSRGPLTRAEVVEWGAANPGEALRAADEIKARLGAT